MLWCNNPVLRDAWICRELETVWPFGAGTGQRSNLGDWREHILEDHIESATQLTTYTRSVDTRRV